MKGPNPNNSHPIAGASQVCFIKSTVSNPQYADGIVAIIKCDDDGNPSGLTMTKS